MGDELDRADPDCGGENESSPPRLNILALPSHTSILFFLIILVVLGAAFASLLPGSQLFWPPIVLGLTMLSFRDFILRPDQDIARFKLARRPEDQEVTSVIEEELATLKTGRLPTVLVTDSLLGIYAFGGIFRSFLGLGRSVAGRFVEAFQTGDKPRDRCRAILAHELGHFMNRDIWLMWLSFGLVKMMIVVMSLNLWIGLNLSIFLVEIGPEVMQPEFWTDLSKSILPGMPGFDLSPIYESFYQEKPLLVERLADPDRKIENWEPFFLYLTAAHWPFALSGLILFLVFWPHLLRSRELYADARAASLMKDRTIIRQAIAGFGVSNRFVDTNLNWREKLSGWLLTLIHHTKVLGKLVATHPDWRERNTCLQDPIQVFGSWRGIAALVGMSIVLLDFLLRGMLTASYVYEPGSHVPMLTAFLVFAIWMIPQVCAGIQSNKQISLQIIKIVLLFSAIKLIPHLLDGLYCLYISFTNPQGGGEVLDLWAYSMSGASVTEMLPIVGVEISWAEIIEWHVVRPMAYFLLMMPPTLIIFLLVDSSLKRQVLTWYALGKRVKWVFFGISGLLAFNLALVVIPIYNRLLFPMIYPNWPIWTLFGMVLSLLSLLLGSVVLWGLDRKFSGRCPHCGAKLQGTFRLGCTCTCKERVHNWLVACY